MKYLKSASSRNMSYSNHAHDSGGKNKSQLGTGLIPEDNSLDGKVCEDACESRLKNLIMPSLNIHINGLGLLNDIDVYFQIVLLDAL
jgi:hypothetical protein